MSTERPVGAGNPRSVVSEYRGVPRGGGGPSHRFRVSCVLSTFIILFCFHSHFADEGCEAQRG